MRRLLLLTALTLTPLVGCATTPLPRFCSAEVAPQVRSYPTPDTFFTLLVHGYDPEKDVMPRPVVDCSGSPVMWQEPVADECREPGPQPTPLPPKTRLEAEDLILHTTQANQRLVWVITRRFSNGEGLGPVALVETTPKGFEVRALGSLRALTHSALLRLERVGDTQVLVAEGEACTESQPQVCRRAARLLPMRNGRFFSEPISDSARACLGSSWFPLSREQVYETPNGLHRKFELTATLVFGGGEITVQEQVAVSDSDPKQPAIPERLYRRAQAERKLKVEDNVLVGNAPSLWVRMVELQLQAGAKMLPDKPVLATPKSEQPAPAPSAAPPAPAPEAPTKPAAPATVPAQSAASARK
jgi:hypothetical protein